MNNYLMWVVIPNIGFALMIIFAISLVCGALYSAILMADNLPFNNQLKLILIICVASLGISVLIPSKGDIMQLQAMVIIKDLKGINELPQNTVDLINKLIKSHLKEE